MKEPEREALRWLRQSEDDLRFVEWLGQERAFFDKGCFLAQQAGEKVLKACLYALGKRRIIGHSLHEMVKELSEQDSRFKTAAAPAKRLDRHYIPTRYPNGLPGSSPFEVFDEDDLISAQDDVQRIFTVARRFLEEKGIVREAG